MNAFKDIRRIRLLLSIALFIIQYTVSFAKCPLGKYGKHCLGICLCHWPGTKTCNHITGACTCKNGYTGRRCDQDINECDLPNPTCNRISMLCRNTFGWYECYCQDGYVLTKVGYCIDVYQWCQKCLYSGAHLTDSCRGTSVGLPTLFYGKHCLKKCSCEADNSMYCDGMGTCICKIGWSGSRCEISHDDCEGKTCPQGTVCVDGHRTHSCMCPEGQRFFLQKCHDYRIDFMASTLTPNVGEMVDVYVLYMLHSMYTYFNDRATDFKYKVIIEENPVRTLCTLSFHKTYRPLTGREPFYKTLQIRYSYNFYSRIKLWFLNATEVTVRLVPVTKEYDEMMLSFDVSYKGQTVIDCLQDMKLTETSSNPRTAIKYKRQSYNSFDVTMNATDECRESPRLEWKFYAVDAEYLDEPDMCLAAGFVWRQNIDALIVRGEEHTISDHRSLREIIPKNTLPNGLNMICVIAHVHMNKRFGAGVCGFIEVIPSFNVEGKLLPAIEFIMMPSDLGITISAVYYEPDRRSKLFYDWVCMYTNITSPDTKTPCLDDGTIIQENSRSQKELVIPGNTLFPDSTFTISVIVTLATNEFVQKRDHIRLQVEGTKYIPLYIMCLKSCHQTIGSNRNLVLSIYFPYHRQHMEFINYFWEITENNRKLTLIENQQILSQALMTHHSIYDTYIVSTRAKTLKPGATYRFRCGANIRMVDKSVRDGHRHLSATSTYVVQIEEPPQGDGCTITPDEGDAVFTRKISAVVHELHGTGEGSQCNLENGENIFFTMTCKNYVDTVAKLPLLYRLYQLETISGQENDFYTLIAYSASSVMANITLSTRKIAGVTTVKLIAEVKNVKGTGVEIPLSVQLTTLDQKKSLGKLGGALSGMGGGQEDARSLKNIATVIGADATASFEDKVAVRREVLNNVFKLETFSSESIEQVSHVLGVSVEKEDEIETSGLDSGIHTAHRLAQFLGKVNNENVDLTRNVAKNQLSAISKLLYVAAVTGENITQMNNTESPEAHSIKTKNKQHSMLATDSFTNIAAVLLNSITSVNETFEMSTEFMNFIVGWTNVSENSNFEVESKDIKFSLPTSDSGVLESEVVESEFEVFKKNPYGWTSSYVHGNLPVVKVNLVRQSEKHAVKTADDTKTVFRFSKPADVFLNFKAEGEETEYSLLIKVVTQKKVKVIQLSSCIFMSVKVSTESATVIKLVSPDRMVMKVKVKYTNIISYFDNLADEDMLDMPMTLPDTFESSAGTLHRDKDLLFLPQLTKQQLKRNNPYYRVKISLKLYQKVNTASLRRVHVNNSKNVEIEEIPSEYYNVTIIATPHVMSCLHFDEVKKDYLSDDCAISMYSNLTMMYCRCVVAAAFTGSVLVLPRLINPLDIGLFLHVFENPLVVSTVIAMWLIYFALISWGHLRDKDDEDKRVITVLDDYAEDHTYVYLICVVTGWSASAATSSNVFIYLKGSWCQSENHALQDPVRRLFQSGAENWFMLATKDDVGDLLSVVVWTDFSGAIPSWFLSTIYVQNMQTSESWICPFNSWISEHLGKAQLLAEVPAFKEREYTSKWMLQIASKGHNDIRNEHLWFGIIAKTSYNKFTRVRRLTTAVSLLQTLMILNLMFFGIRDQDDPGQFIEVLDQRIHLTSVIIGIQTSFIIFVLGVGISMLFNKIAPYPKIVKEDEEKTNNMKEFIHRRKTIQSLYEINDSSIVVSEESEEEIRPAGSGGGSSRDRNMSNRAYSVDETKLYAKHSSPVDRAKDEEIVYVESEPLPEPKVRPHAPFLLPYWFIYVTWTSLIIFNVFLSYYIMLYGLSLGYEKSVDWELAFFTGFFMNVIVIQPMKVFFMVFLLVLIFKQGHTFKEHAPVAQLNESIMLVQERKSYNRKYKTLLPRIGCRAPVHSAQAKSVLERLEIEAGAREMLRDLFLHTLFLISVLLVSYGHVDVHMQYLQSQHTKSVFLGETVHGDVEGYYIPGYLGQVVKVEDMWLYLENIVAPEMTKDKIIVNIAHDAYLMGTARLRQIRAKPNTSEHCSELPREIRGFFLENSCAYASFTFPEETNSYEGTWRYVSNISKDDIDDSPYVYRSPHDLGSTTFIGLHGIYSGGGYVVPFGRDDLSAMKSLLITLYQSDWINELTRCLFLEFTLYNPGSDLFTNAMIAFEFDNFGAIFPYISIHSGMFFNDKRRQQVWLQLSESFMLVYIIFYLIVEIHSLRQKGCSKYFLNLWNCLEVAIIFLTITVGVLFFLRYAEFVKILKNFQTYGHGRFMDFQFAFRMHKSLHISLALLGSLSILKMLRVTSFNRFVDVSFRTFANSRADFFGLSLVTLMFLFNFSLTGLLIFGPVLESYMSIDRGFFTLLFFIMGEPDYHSLVAVDLYMGRLYFVVIVVVCQYIVMNFFCSILREGYELTRYMAFKQQQETVKYMTSTIRYYAGYGVQNEKAQ